MRYRRQRSPLPVILVLIVLGVALGILWTVFGDTVRGIVGLGDGDAAPIIGNNPTRVPPDQVDRGNPEGVAITFLDAWKAGDYEGMYGLLSDNSKQTYSREEFIQAYESTATAMTLIDVDYRLNSLIPNEQAGRAQAAFNLTYNTQVLGPIEQPGDMILVMEDDGWGITWRPSMILPQLTGGNYLAIEPEIPSRANIYDRNGQWMVSANASIVTLSIVPGQLGNREDDIVELLSQMLRRTPGEVRTLYQGLPEDQIWPIGDVDLETYNEYRNQYESYPALRASTKTGRRYYASLAPHILGYTSFIGPEQCESYQARGYRCDEIVGQYGIELWGEEILAGQRGGSLAAYSPGGQFVAEIASRQPEPAQSIYLTIDRDLQEIVQEAVVNAYRYSQSTWVNQAGGAAVVVLEANSGRVLAMASFPDFDPNVLNPNNAHPQANTYPTTITNNPLRPFFNRATQGEYPAGSVFKIVTATAALESGIYDMNSTYGSVGVWRDPVSGTEKFDWLAGGHGTLNISQALTASCNSCFYDVGYKTGQQDFNILPNAAREYGFGSELGIEIAEEPGNIPTPSEGTLDGREWSLLDSVNMAIGQGEVLVTPLQIATMTAAIANGGTVYRPTLVDRIGIIGEEPTQVFQPEIIRQISLSDEETAFLQEGMNNVTSDAFLGTAEYRLGSMQISSAGKTGTAQVSSDAPPIAWFTGYVPAEDPEIVVTIMVENGGQGSGVAAPIFRRIVERWYGLPVLDYPPDWGDPELFEFVEDEFAEGEVTADEQVSDEDEE